MGKIFGRPRGGLTAPGESRHAESAHGVTAASDPLASAPAGDASRPTDSHTLRRNALALTAGQMFTWLMTLAWTLVVPRLLGARGMGMIVTGMSVVALLQIALGAGTALYVTREIVVSPERTARTVASAAIVRLMLVPLFAGAIVAWTHFAHYGPTQDEVLYLCGLATALMLLSEPLLSFFQATERMHYMAIADAVNKASQGVIGILLTVLGFGAIGFGACWVASSAVVLLLSIGWTRRFIPLRLKASWFDVRHIVAGSVSYWTGGVFFTIYLWIDSAMLSLMTDSATVGWYGVPMRLWGSFFIPASILVKVFFPRLVDAHKRSDDEFRRLARAPLELIFVISLPVAAAIVVGAGPGLGILYGPSYARSVPIMMILGVTLVPMCLNMVLGMICTASGRQRTMNWLMVGATVVNPAANAVLIPLTQQRFGNGGIGAAIAMLVTESLIAAASLVLFGRGVINGAVGQRIARMGAACATLVVTVYLLGRLGPILSLTGGVAAFIAAAAVLRVMTQPELDGVRRLASGRVAALGARRARRVDSPPAVAAADAN